MRAGSHEKQASRLSFENLYTLENMNLQNSSEKAAFHTYGLTQSPSVRAGPHEKLSSHSHFAFFGAQKRFAKYLQKMGRKWGRTFERARAGEVCTGICYTLEDVFAAVLKNKPHAICKNSRLCGGYHVGLQIAASFGRSRADPIQSRAAVSA